MKIFAVGMNYKAHIQELADQIPTEPVIFMKPDTALLPNGETFFIPEFSGEIHYETELVIKINKKGKSIKKESACEYYNELSVGIDFTARDLQRTLRAKGNPWEICKAFDQSAGVGVFVDMSGLKEKGNISFSLDINGKTVQQGYSSDMLFGFDEIIAYVSRFFTLEKGDLIFTGTPSGIGRIVKGDILEGFLENAKILEIQIENFGQFDRNNYPNSGVSAALG